MRLNFLGLIFMFTLKPVYNCVYFDIDRCSRNNSTFQRGIDKKWYKVSAIFFSNVDIDKFFTSRFKNYISQMVTLTANTHL